MKPTQIDRAKQVSTTVLEADEEGEPNEAVADDEELRLARLYQAAKDENELLEFKNYELLFKIQELEQNQRDILSKLKINEREGCCTESSRPEESLGSKQLAIEIEKPKMSPQRPIEPMREVHQHHDEDNADRYQENRKRPLACPPTTNLNTFSLASSGKSPTARREEAHNNGFIVVGPIDAGSAESASAINGNETETGQHWDPAQRKESASRDGRQLGAAARLTEAANGRSGARSDPSSEVPLQAELDLRWQQVVGMPSQRERQQVVDGCTGSHQSDSQCTLPVGEQQTTRRPLTGSPVGSCWRKSDARHHLGHEKSNEVASKLAAELGSNRRLLQSEQAEAISEAAAAATTCSQSQSGQQQVADSALARNYSIARKTNKGEEIFGLHDMDLDSCLEGSNKWKFLAAFKDEISKKVKELEDDHDDHRETNSCSSLLLLNDDEIEMDETSLGAFASSSNVTRSAAPRLADLIEYNGGQRAAIVAGSPVAGQQQQSEEASSAVGGPCRPSLTSSARPAKVMIASDERAKSGLPSAGQQNPSASTGRALALRRASSSLAIAEFAPAEQPDKPQASKSPPEEPSSVIMSPSSKLNQEARKMAQSQPELAKQPPEAAVRSRPGNARIAVPVSRSRVPAAPKAKQAPKLGPANNGLRVRSKSSLDQSSLLSRRRGKGGMSGGQQVVKPLRASNSASGPASKPRAAQDLSRSASGGCGNLLSAKLENRSRSSSAIGFVTQIPTLISQLHAPSQQADKRQLPMAARRAATGAPTAELHYGSERALDSSSSFSNRAPIEQAIRPIGTSSVGRATVAQLDKGPIEANRSEQAPMNGSKSLSNLTGLKPFEESSQSASSNPSLLDSAGADDEPECKREREEFSRNGETVSLRAEPDAAAADADHRDRHEDSTPRDKTGRQWGSLLPKAVICSCVSRSASASCTEPGCKRARLAASGGQPDERLEPQKQPQQQQQQQCAQCKLFQSKLNLLISDRKQLNEQVSELEEMENDSRLMSQKLAKQLLALEQQFESCKFELQKTCDSEAMLQFQNKRLHLELNKRLDSIQQLQGQVSELQQQLAGQNNEGPPIGGGGEGENKQRPANNGIDSTRNAHEIGSAQQKRLSATQSNLSGTSTSTDDQAGSKSAGSGDQDLEQSRGAPNANANANAADDNSPALSISATSQHSDDDSAIDVFEKRTEPAQQPETTGAPAGANESTSIDDLDQAPPRKPRLPSQAEDSAYSKSSGSSTVSSSDAHSDDGSRSDGEQADLDRLDQCGVDARPTAVSSSSSGDESDHQDTDGCNAGAPGTDSQGPLHPATGNGQPLGGRLAGRQQVLRKKISTARILRGIQVTQQSPMVAGGQQVARPAGEPPIMHNPIESSPSSSNSAFVGQARLAQVIDNNVTGIARDQDGQLDKAGCEADRMEPSKSLTCQSREQQRGVKSPIDLALEGVDDLERGGGDEALRSLAANSSSNSTSLTLVALGDHEKVRDQAEPVAAHQLLIRQCKQEIANLKMRLLQAQTLNDNLVAELKSTNKQHANPIKVIDQPSLADEMNLQAAAASSRQRSVIYVNGVQASITHNHNHHHHQIGSNSNNNQVLLGPCQSSPACQGSLGPINPSYNHNQATACINMNELVDFLRFLLDKVHFHHQRTFELVNECQKLAMNALLASYSHQLNLVHYNGVVLAGNQATRTASSSGAAGESAAAPRLQSSQSKPNVYPVRPPPRRRNALSRMLVSGGQQQQISFSGQDEQLLSESAQSAGKKGAEPPTGGRGPVSALQVAKQTLFSIVPIYYNSTAAGAISSLANGNSSSKNNKEKSAAEQWSKPRLPSEVQSANAEPNPTGKLGESEQRISKTNGNSAGSIDRQTAPAKSRAWILLNRSASSSSPSSSSSATKTGNNRQQQQQPEAADYPRAPPARHVNEQQRNVSVLRINRAESSSNDLLINDHQHQLDQTTSAQQQQQHVQAYDSLLGSLQQQQQLVKVKNSLSEDIERYRVRFNGQLLDLLTRQNWCESIITDKLRAYQTIDHNQRSFSASSGNRPNPVMDTQSLIVAPSINKSANVPINNISLNPNGSVHQSQPPPSSSSSSRLRQQQQQQQQQQRHSWSIQGHGASSFC